MSIPSDPFAPLLDDPIALSSRLRRAGVSDDEDALLDAVVAEVATFCRDHVDAAANDARGAFTPSLLAAAGERGLFGLTVPSEHGGAGLSLKAATRVVVELGAHDGSLAACVGLHAGLGMHGLLHRGSPAAQARYLADVASGRRILSFAATEPEAGSDISALRTTLATSRSSYALTGSKCYVTNGGLSGLVTVLARSPGLGGARAGHALVLVDPSARGVTRGREEKKLGLRASSTLTLDFDDVEVDADHVLGELGRGLDYAHEALAWGRTLMAAGCVGTTRAALEQVAAHVEVRRQFGRALGAFPRVRAVLANATADHFVAESLVRLVGELAARAPSALGVGSAAAKIVASEVAWSAVDRAIQLMGGAGYLEDHGMARRLRDVRVTRIFEGSNDVLRLHVAASLLRPSTAAPWRSLGASIDEARRPSAARLDAKLEALRSVAAAARSRLGARIFAAQRLQGCLADGLLAAYGAGAVLLRGPSTGAPRDRAIAELAFDRCLGRLGRAIDAATVDAAPTAGWIDAITAR